MEAMRTFPMKHVFFVHSHICYAITVSVIDHRALRPANVLLITDRKYEPPSEVWARVESPPEDWHRFEKNVFVGRKLIGQLEHFVAEHCGDAFEYYCPHTLSPFNDFMARHRACKAYHLMEEGTNSYLSHEEIDSILPPAQVPLKWRLWSLAFYGGLQRTHSFFGPGPTHAYCSSDDAFPTIASRVVLPLDFQRIFPRAAPAGMSSILCLSSAVETHLCSPEHFLEGIARLIEFHRATRPAGEPLYVKRHPYQWVETAFFERLMESLKHGLGHNAVHELPADVAVESIRWTPGMRLYVGLTSLAIYASRNGATCYSYAKTIARNDEAYRRRLQQQPKAFLDTVKFI